jgi:uncharacterized protein YciI
MTSYYLLFYELSDDYLARRPSVRDEHLTLARAASERGALLLAGACGDPVDRAVLLFRGASAAIAERFAKQDPYVREGLVTHWKVRPWNVVVGRMLAARG